MEMPDRDKAVLLEISGNPTEAERLYRRVLSAHPEDKECVLGFARLLLRQGRIADARERLTVFSAAYPKDAEVESVLAAINAQAGTPPKVRKPTSTDQAVPGGTYYGENYFNWQKHIGAFGGMANLFKFRDHIRPTDTVVDLGSGGGYLLSNLNCAFKMGVEINPVARREASLHAGIESVERVEDLPDGYADVVISNHALEHIHSPLAVLRALLPKIKAGGKIVIVVPNDPPQQEWDSQDINKHLFTWNPMTLGNLVSLAGFKVIRAEAIQHQWPPEFAQVYERLGEQGFHDACREQAKRSGNHQIRVIAVRE
jgi:SAM-dependent methyltransferase